MAVTDLVQENSVIGDYNIYNIVGKGNGVVYRATQVGSEVSLAIKFVEPTISHTGLDLKKTMETERKIHLALGSHPKIAGIVDAFDVDVGAMVLANVYEYVDAVPSEELISGTLGIDKLIIIGYDGAEAIAHTHGKGILHTDIKPHNVLVDRNTGRAKLADFGLAAVESELPPITDSSWDTCRGSAHYMSPEQICGLNISYTTDLYSFGAALYHMLTGEVPVETKNMLTGEEVHEGGAVRYIKKIMNIKTNLQCNQENKNYGLRTDIPKELGWALEGLVKAIRGLREGNKNKRPEAPEALNWFEVLKHDLAA